MHEAIKPLTFLEAIAREEGYFTAGTRANRNRNPGNMEWGPFTREHGALASDGRFAIFPTAAAGWACMRALFEAHYKGLTVEQAVRKWAPPSENATAQYVERVCWWARLKADDLVDGLLAETAAA